MLLHVRNWSYALQTIGRARIQSLCKSTQSTLDAFKAENPKIKIICADLSDWTQTKPKLDSLETIDYLVNNAAIMVYGNFLDMTMDSLDSAFETNLKSLINISQLIAKKMIAQGNGQRVFNAKAALDMLTKSMAFELAPHKIRANSVNPGLILTDMGKDVLAHRTNPTEAANNFLERCPMKKCPTELQVANTILLLLSEYSAMTTGETMLVEGGYLTN